MYAIKCGSDSEIKLKGISQSPSKISKYEEYYNCLFGGEYQKECDIYIIRSVNHEICLQRLHKSTVSLFDDKPCYKNHIESTPWNESCTKTPMAIFLVNFFQQVRVSIPSRVPPRSSQIIEVSRDR